MLLYDLETDGFLRAMTTIHVMVIKDSETKQRWVFRGPKEARKGAKMLADATQCGKFICAHNGKKFDRPGMNKLFPDLYFVPEFNIDSLAWARAVVPDLKPSDMPRVKRGDLPPRLKGSHSLEAWGYRLGCHKGEFAGPWDVWTQEMEDYCIQDVDVLEALVDHLMSCKLPRAAADLEQGVAEVLGRQERFGVWFNESGAVELYARLATKRDALHNRLVDEFPVVYRSAGEFTPKRDNTTLGYVAGATFTRLKQQQFMPSSREQVIYRLKRMFGWEPTEFTSKGRPKIDDAVLLALPYPEVQPLAEFYLLEKRIAQIATGDAAWLKKVVDGRIHGSVNTCGAVTVRMTHSDPNLAQVPSNRAPYGEECRALFGPPPGWYQVGADADALELRCLAARMSVYDGGAYVDMVLNGRKEDGTDVHSRNAIAFGLDPKAKYFDGESGRDIAKTAFYALIYGAGDEKFGFILTHKRGDAAKAEGKRLRKKFMKAMPAFKKLVDAIKEQAKEKGYLRGLDRRRLRVRSAHSALNTQLQHDGAWIMKKALLILDAKLQEMGFRPADPKTLEGDYEFMLNVHDEWQIAARTEEIAHAIGKAAVAAIVEAGESIQYACPLAGAYDVGRNWAATH